ncbi:MAG: lipopolysaccharide heptosyltransferase II [Gammaproteobacteria bacterium]|nr:lipopolysaccharide heptosyltransferase II [Gammaproteobacteria bacterium]
MNKILIVAPAWVGDMVMAQSLLIQLKLDHPQAIIDVVAPSWVLPLLERMPEVNKAIAMPISHGQFKLAERYRLGKQLRTEKYDQAFVLPNSWKSALIPFFAKIPKRTGWLGEMRYGLLNDWRKLDKIQFPKMVQRFVALAYPKNQTWSGQDYPLPALSIKASEADAKLALYQLDLNKPILALCPGAAFGPAKRWPTRYFAEVATKKISQGWQVWIFGSKAEQIFADEIQELSDNRCINLTGKTSLADMVDLLSLAQAVVSNDSGPMHIAASLHRPLVAVYGSSSADFTPPLSNNVIILSVPDLPCRPCFQRECPLGHMKCLNDLEPAWVLSAIDTLGTKPL